MINKANFYKTVRLQFKCKLTNTQVLGFEAIINEFERQGLKDMRWLAYMLATAWHETATTMAAISEYGKGKGKPYGKKLKHSGVAYALNQLFYGRGLVQLTWYENYELMGRLLGLDLLKNPDLALVLENAVKIMFEGMLRGSSSTGDFTGKCLEIYFNAKTNDPVGARRIINGTDKAKEIASHHNKFLISLAA